MTSCGCLVLEKVEDHGGKAAANGRRKIASRAGCGSCTGKWRSRSETIFPIYVMGNLRPSTVAAARNIVDSAGDPIWDTVKSEAKFERQREELWKRYNGHFAKLSSVEQMR